MIMAVAPRHETLLVMERMDAHAVDEIVEKSVREGLGPPDGEPITRDQIARVARGVAERFVKLLAHKGAFDEDE